ncbi:DMT family transporter [Pacificibacter marinus]|uniref:Riboflavin transporter n=1 Tax=Pacificibacter marinus TaxID=658057 RepID=A0A1Y5T379_9RHOB|nr:DMT family transporter [Pacificibacter marinus]SEL00243.1 EamA-like transporter family protein [Pacificibacter marinus]SLN54723.1 Riboflavin transporter [Pacificibacter marinus]
MNNVNGILLMILAMAGFALEDLFVKLLSSSISTAQILIVMGLASSSIFAAMAFNKGHNVFAAQSYSKTMIARAVVEAMGAIAFVTSLSLVPISTVAAVFQVTPLAITMGAALFLGEQVGWRRWTAIAVGFFGVIVIIRPGLSGFDPAVLYVLVAVVCISARDLLTRRIPTNIASTVISFQAFASLIFAGALLLVLSSDTMVQVSKLEVAYFAGGIVFGVAGYYGLVTATRIGDASTVTPFRYTRLLFSIVVGVIVFNERPDALTLLGAAIIIGTGLFTFLRERKLSSR